MITVNSSEMKDYIKCSKEVAASALYVKILRSLKDCQTADECRRMIIVLFNNDFPGENKNERPN